MTDFDIDTQILIVGGGPVGMVLALQLDARGVDCLLVNTESDVRWHPKGNTHNSRTMEHYRRLGMADRIRPLGLPADCATDVIYYTRLTGQELARISMPSANEKLASVAAAPLTDQILEPIHRANQMYVEREIFRILGERAAANGHLDARYGWQCSGFEDKGDHVTATIEPAGGGTALSVRAQYLVGCDGGGGETRRALGIRYSGEGGLDQAFFGPDMLSTYLRAPAIHRDLIHEQAWQYWAVNQDARAALVNLDGHDEFLMLGRLQPGETPDNDRLVRLLREAVGVPVEVEIIGNRGWTGGQALVADSFQAGRVLLAGDSVHLFTPTGGFGMNTGIDDTANLSWKLAAMVQGWGGPGLIDSYEMERRPIALRNTDASHALARSVGDVPVAEDMESDSPAAAEARAKAGAFLAGFGEEFASIGIQLGARYDGSPLIADDPEAPPPDDPAFYAPSAVPGGRAPHAWLENGGGRTSLFDRFGNGFTLLCLAGADGGALAESARILGIPLDTLSVEADHVRDLYGRDYALIRPDHHVAWRGNALPAEPGDLLKMATGWMVAESPPSA